MANLYLARQPIYDADLKVFAYELLYRATEENQAPSDLGDEATYTVLVNALTEIGLDALVGQHYAFINFTRAFIVGHNPLPFTGGNVVIEVLEDVPADQEVIEGTMRLSKLGHKIALDDFVYNEEMHRLLQQTDIVKLDVTQLSYEEIKEHIEIIRNYGVKLLAEKVETQEDFERYRELGFNYFQGFFFCKPKMVSQKRVPMNQLALTQLLAKLNEPDVGVEELEKIIGTDVALSYKLFRYVNSAFFSLPSKMESLRQVIVYLGLKTIKQWAIVLTLSKIEDKPNELLVTALVRAKMCEQLSHIHQTGQQNAMFIVGLFSLLDALLDMPMEEILEKLHLTDQIKQAILTHEGKYGEILSRVIAYEQARWDEVACFDDSEDDCPIQQSYLNAISWAQQAIHGIQDE